MRRRFFNNNIKNFDINDYLTIEALEDNLQVYFSNEDLMYGIDGLGWQKLIAGQYSPPINAGQTISFKGNVNSTVGNIKSFIITKRCNLLGNCMSLTLNDVPQFYKLFVDCTTIVHISKDFLPATTLVESCYGSMFNGCTNLTTAPELPATTLTYGCYLSMFHSCISLTTAPELPATKLTDWCYDSMFSGCNKLNYIKMLATDISAYRCLINWVSNVSTTGTFVKNKNATWKLTGDSGVPSGWTVYNDGEEPGGSNLITFTIDGTEYQAEEGMTWGEWVASEYNTNGFYINGVGIFIGTQMSGQMSGQIYNDNSLSTYTEPSDTIINGHSYGIGYGGTGN